MNISKYIRYVAPLLYMVLMFFLSSIPGHRLESIDLIEFDKLLHFAEYSLLGFISSWSFLGMEDYQPTSGRMTFIIILGWGFGISDEFHQSFVPNRGVDYFDLFADMTGVIAGLILYIIFIKMIYPRLKSA